jgi:hypothetical protein
MIGRSRAPSLSSVASNFARPSLPPCPSCIGSCRADSLLPHCIAVRFAFEPSFISLILLLIVLALLPTFVRAVTCESRAVRRSSAEPTLDRWRCRAPGQEERLQSAALARRCASTMAAVAASALAVFKPRSSVSLRMRGSGGGSRTSSLLSRCGTIAVASLDRGRYSSTGIGALAWFQYSGSVAFSPVRAAPVVFKASIF